MGSDDRDADHDYLKLRERSQTLFAILWGLLVAFGIGMTFLYILARHVARGVGSEVGD